MTHWIQQLLWHSLTMSFLVVAYYAGTVWLRKQYAARWFYLAGIVLLIGFFIPLRPAFTVNMQNVPQALQQVIPQEALELPTGTATSKSIHGGNGTPVWTYIFFIWVTGAAMTILYQAIKHIRFVRTITRWCVKIEDAQLLAEFETAQKDLQLAGRDIGFAFCTGIPGPMLIRLKRPTVLLPESHGNTSDIQFILRHELIHYKRKDLWVRTFMLLTTALHWFNPAVYLLVKFVTLQCELSCDEKVVENHDMDGRHQYVMSIIGAGKGQAISPTLLTTHFIGGKKSVKQRIHSIYTPRKRKYGRVFILCTLIVTLLAGASVAAVGGEIGYMLPSMKLRSGEMVDDYAVRWKSMENIREYHIGVFFHFEMEGVNGHDEYWTLPEGVIGDGEVTDSQGVKYTVNGIWDVELLNGDATEIDISRLINKHLYFLKEERTESLLGCYVKLIAVRESGPPIDLTIELPMA